MMEAADVYRFIVVVRDYISAILAFNGVMTTDEDIALFDGHNWRTFWYDPDTGVAAISAWNASFLVNKNYFLPGRNESTRLSEHRIYSRFQFPPAAMLPTIVFGQYVMKRLPDMDMNEFHNLYPARVPLIEVPGWTEKWCERNAIKS